MPRRPFPRPARLIAAAALLGFLCAGASAGERRKPVFTRPSYDPSAREVELFDAMEAGEIEAKLVPKNSKGGNLLVENKTDEPLTVKMPKAFVGVHVFKQLGGGMGGMGGGMGGMGGGMGGMGGGGQQAMGGGMGGMGGGGMGGMGGMGGGGMGGGGGGGIFSVPAESVARLPYQSVCLEHGKPDPTPGANYEIRPVESFTEDPALQELVGLIGSNRVDLEAAQAAAWHLADDMSWDELAAKKVTRLGGVGPQPYFAPGKLAGAQTLVSVAAAKAREAKASAGASEAKPKAATAAARIR